MADYAKLDQVRAALSKRVGREVSPQEVIQVLSEATDLPPEQVLSYFGIEQNESLLGDLGTAVESGIARIPEGIGQLVDYAAAKTRDLRTVLGVANAVVSGQADNPEVGKDLAEGYAHGSGHYFTDNVRANEERLFGTTGSDRAEDFALEYTPETVEGQRAVDQAEGFVDTLGAYASHPRVAAVEAVESLTETAPEMLAGGLLGRALKVTGAPAEARVAAGTFGAGMAQTIPGQMEAVQDYNEKIGQDFFTDTQLDAVGGSSALTGVIGVAGAKLSHVLGGETADSYVAKVLAGDTAESVDGVAATLWDRIKATPKTIPASAFAEGFSEAAQSVQESAATAAVTDERITPELLGKSAAQGLAVGGAMGVGAGMAHTVLPTGKHHEQDSSVDSAPASTPVQDEQPEQYNDGYPETFDEYVAGLSQVSPDTDPLDALSTVTQIPKEELQKLDKDGLDKLVYAVTSKARKLRGAQSFTPAQPEQEVLDDFDSTDDLDAALTPPEDLVSLEPLLEDTQEEPAQEEPAQEEPTQAAHETPAPVQEELPLGDIPVVQEESAQEVPAQEAPAQTAPVQEELPLGGTQVTEEPKQVTEEPKQVTQEKPAQEEPTSYVPGTEAEITGVARVPFGNRKAKVTDHGAPDGTVYGEESSKGGDTVTISDGHYGVPGEDTLSTPAGSMVSFPTVISLALESLASGDGATDVYNLGRIKTLAADMKEGQTVSSKTYLNPEVSRRSIKEQIGALNNIAKQFGLVVIPVAEHRHSWDNSAYPQADKSDEFSFVVHKVRNKDLLKEPPTKRVARQINEFKSILRQWSEEFGLGEPAISLDVRAAGWTSKSPLGSSLVAEDANRPGRVKNIITLDAGLVMNAAYGTPEEQLRAYETLAHEFGHSLVDRMLSQQPEKVQKAVLADYERWKTSTAQSDTVRTPMVHASIRGKAASTNGMAYLRSFDEWAADQVARYILKEHLDEDLTPHTRLFIQKLAAVLKRVYNKFKELVSRRLHVAPSMEEFLNSLRQYKPAKDTAAINTGKPRGVKAELPQPATNQEEPTQKAEDEPLDLMEGSKRKNYLMGTTAVLAAAASIKKPVVVHMPVKALGSPVVVQSIQDALPALREKAEDSKVPEKELVHLAKAWVAATTLSQRERAVSRKDYEALTNRFYQEVLGRAPTREEINAVVHYAKDRSRRQNEIAGLLKSVGVFTQKNVSDVELDAAVVSPGEVVEDFIVETEPSPADDTPVPSEDSTLDEADAEEDALYQLNEDDEENIVTEDAIAADQSIGGVSKDVTPGQAAMMFEGYSHLVPLAKQIKKLWSSKKVRDLMEALSFIATEAAASARAFYKQVDRRNAIVHAHTQLAEAARLLAEKPELLNPSVDTASLTPEDREAATLVSAVLDYLQRSHSAPDFNGSGFNSFLLQETRDMERPQEPEGTDEKTTDIEQLDAPLADNSRVSVFDDVLPSLSDDNFDEHLPLLANTLAQLESISSDKAKLQLQQLKNRGGVEDVRAHLAGRIKQYQDESSVEDAKAETLSVVADIAQSAKTAEELRARIESTPLAVPFEVALDALPEDVRGAVEQFLEGKIGKDWRDVMRAAPSFTLTSAPVLTKHTTPKRIRAAIGEALGTKRPKWVHIFTSPKQAADYVGTTIPENTAGFVFRGEVYFITSNIPEGAEASIVAHEIGAHVAIEQFVDAKKVDEFIRAIQELADAGDPLAREAAKKARASTEAAGGLIDDTHFQERFGRELLAAYVELAVAKGVKPSLFKRIVYWITDLLRKAGINVKPQFLDAHLVELTNGLMQRLDPNTEFFTSPYPALHDVSPILSVADGKKGKSKKGKDAQREEDNGPSVEKLRPVESTVLGRVSTGTADAVVPDKNSFLGTVKSRLADIDVGTSFLADVVSAIERYKPAAVREGWAEPGSRESMLLPSLHDFVENLQARNRLTEQMKLPNDRLQQLFATLPLALREEVNTLLQQSRYYGLWPVDPTDWHPAFNINALRALDPQLFEDEKKALEIEEKINKRAEWVKNSIATQIKMGEQLKKQGKTPDSRMVAWRYNNLRKGLSADGKKLKDDEAAYARTAAALIEQALRMMYDYRVSELKATEAATGVDAQLQRKVELSEEIAELEKYLDGDESADMDIVQRAVGLNPGEKLTKTKAKRALAIAHARMENMNVAASQLATMKRKLYSSIRPYVPQMRTGNYFLVAKSDLYSALDGYTEAQVELQEFGKAEDPHTRRAHLDSAETLAKRSILQTAQLLDKYASDARLKKYIKAFHIALANATGLDEGAVKNPDILERAVDDDPDRILHDKDLRTAVRKLRAVMRVDANHYGMFGYQSETARATAMEAMNNRLKDNNPTGITFQTVNRVDLPKRLRLDHEALASLEAHVKNLELGDKEKEMLETAIQLMHLEAYSDLVTVQSKNKYEGVFGADPAATMQLISTYARETAQYIASMRYNREIETALHKMEREARRTTALDNEDRAAAQRFYTTLVHRWAELRKSEPPVPLVEAALTATSYYTLLTSMSYHLINSLQPELMSIPHAAAASVMVRGKLRVVGFARASKHITKIHGELASYMTSAARELEKKLDKAAREGRALSEEEYNQLLPVGKVKTFIDEKFKDTPEYAKFLKDLIDDLYNRELLDIGLNTEMGDLDVLATSLERKEGSASKAGAAVASGFSNFHQLTRAFTQAIETINRAAAAIGTVEALVETAGFQHNKDDIPGVYKHKFHDRAVWTVRDTQGDYSRTGSPVWFMKRGWMQFGLQFRRYGHIMGRMLFKQIKYGFLADKYNLDLTPEERAEARRILGRVLLWHGVWLGAAGLPATWAISAALLLLGIGCDDEECDMARTLPPSEKTAFLLKELFGEQLGEILNTGVLSMITGADLSARMGLANTFGIMPFESESVVDLLSDGDTAVKGAAKLVFGAAGGVVTNFINGVQLMRASDVGSYNWLRGLAYASPAGVRNLIYAYMYHTEGVKTRSYRTLLDKEELNWLDITLKGIGFQPKKVADIYTHNAFRNDYTKHLREMTSAIQRNYYYAWLHKDKDAMRELEKKWLELNKVKAKLGMRPGRLRDYIRRKIREDNKPDRLRLIH